MMKYVFVLSLALIAAVYCQDVQVLGSFSAKDSQVSSNNVQVMNLAGSQLTSVTYTVLPIDGSIAIYYPGGATRTTVGTISTGASGFGSFQLLGSAGNSDINITVSYRKGGVLMSFTSTHYLSIGDGGSTEGKRSEDSIVVNAEPIQVTRENADVILGPSGGYTAVESVATWQSLQVSSTGAALNSVTFSVVPTDLTCGIYYGPEGNRIANIAPNGFKSGNFQMLANYGEFQFRVTVNYRKGNVAYSYTENMDVLVQQYGGASTEGKRAIFGVSKFLPSIQNMNALTVAGLAVGGVALIAIVAVVAVVVVKRQRTQTIA